MVADAADYAWSSYRHNALGKPDPLLRPHNTYLQIATSDEARRTQYRALVAEGISADELHALRLYSQRQRALGPDRFQQQIEGQLARHVGIGQLGRPRKRRPENL